MKSVVKIKKSEIISVSRKIEISNRLLASIDRKKKTILIVDDVQEYQKLFTESLMHKFKNNISEIYTANDGIEALNLVTKMKGNLDLITTCLSMPYMDGLELIEKIREKFKAIKILVISGISKESMMDRAISAGADIYLEKPTDFATLHKSVKILLNI